MYYDIMCQYDDSNMYLIADKLIRNGRKKKLQRKVSNYRGKDEKFLIELKCGNEFVEEILKVNESDSKIFKEAYERFLNSVSKKTKRGKHKIHDIRNGYYMHCRLNTIIIKNKYVIYKCLKYDDKVEFYANDIFEYVCLLFQAKKENKVKEFLDVPDVSFVTRKLSKTGLDLYFK